MDKKLKNLLERNGKIYEEFKTSKTPMFIFGESFFKLKSAEYLFTNTKKFLNYHENQFKKGWKSLNCLSKNASSVGAKDLNITNQELVLLSFVLFFMYQIKVSGVLIVYLYVILLVNQIL